MHENPQLGRLSVNLYAIRKITKPKQNPRKGAIHTTLRIGECLRVLGPGFLFHVAICLVLVCSSLAWAAPTTFATLGCIPHVPNSQLYLICSSHMPGQQSTVKQMKQTIQLSVRVERSLIAHYKYWRSSPPLKMFFLTPFRSTQKL